MTRASCSWWSSKCCPHKWNPLYRVSTGFEALHAQFLSWGPVPCAPQPGQGRLSLEPHSVKQVCNSSLFQSVFLSSGDGGWAGAGETWNEGSINERTYKGPLSLACALSLLTPLLPPSFCPFKSTPYSTFFLMAFPIHANLQAAISPFLSIFSHRQLYHPLTALLLSF